MRFIEEILSDIRKGEHIKTYLTILASLLISFLGFTKIATPEQLNSSILAILTVILFSLLQNRKSESSPARVEKIFSKYAPNEFQGSVPQASKVIIWAVSLSKTMSSWEAEFSKALKRGAELEFLLVKQESSALKMAALTLSPQTSEDEENQKLRSSLKRLAQIAHSQDKLHRVVVRELDYLPPWGVLAINPDSNSGFMQVSLRTYETETTERLSFKLSAKKDGYWFKFVKNRYDLAWKKADEVKLEELLK